MSIIGTGIAAGVANTGQAARQQTTSESGKDAQRAGAAQQTDKFKITQLHGAGATRDADQEMPDHAAPGYEDLYPENHEHPDEQDQPDGPANRNDQIHDADAPGSTPTGIPLPPSYGPHAKDYPLFHALNVKA